MKVEYINKDYDITENRFYAKSSPLTYRVSVYETCGDVITIKREYFKYGYHDHESLDDICIMSSGDELDRVSIFTRNFDEKHLKDIETLVINTYQQESNKLINKIQKNLEKKINRANIQTLHYDKLSKFLKNYERREKLKTLKHII